MANSVIDRTLSDSIYNLIVRRKKVFRAFIQPFTCLIVPCDALASKCRTVLPNQGSLALEIPKAALVGPPGLFYAEIDSELK